VPDEKISRSFVVMVVVVVGRLFGFVRRRELVDHHHRIYFKFYFFHFTGLIRERRYDQ
jgi:hypothetical protein